MLNYVSGILDSIDADSITIDANGIGYEISVSGRFLSKIGKVGDSVKVFVYLSVREDGISLFGFEDKAEKNMFLRLISISGIGPKLAISILGGISAGDLSVCIANADAKALSSIKGIGRKTAERIILELRDKITEEIVTIQSNSTRGSNSVLEEAETALISLGFSAKEAKSLVSGVATAGLTVEEIVMKSLKGGK